MSFRPLGQAISRPRLRHPRINLLVAVSTRPRFLNTVPRCPSPTCDCADTPAMPEGLAIDYEGNLNGLISGYAEQVLICTGRGDWPSRIEEDNSGDNLAADLKELVGRGGIYSDPFHNVSILNSSFPSSISRRPEIQTTSAYLLPSFKYVPFLPRISFDSVQALVKGFLLPEKLHPMNDGLSPIHKDRLLRKEAFRHLLPGVCDVDDVLVLICGHGGRDMRCGVMGPVLQAEFERQLPQAGFEVLHGPVLDEGVSAPALPGTGSEVTSTARVGLISHIGGHKFAGNIIIYLPPTLKNNAGNPHPLAGHGVWYGRIEPKHVEVLALTFVASAGTAYLYRWQYASDNSDDVINTSTFSPFTITGREQVSPTAFILTICPSASVGSEEFDSEQAEDGGRAAGFLSTRIRDAWRHGLWSVEIKQPQLQIARHYTPLPAFSSLPILPPVEEQDTVSVQSSDTNGLQTTRNHQTNRGQKEQDEQADLRFLIRKIDGGEMSNYLARQRVGDTIWLRGPHLGFDVVRRLGHSNDNGDSNDGDTEISRIGSQRGLVFLAGGTGIAPALQIAHKLLDGPDSSKDQPRISILWANRRGADALGRGHLPSLQGKSKAWFRWSNSSADQELRKTQTDENPSSSLALQIQGLQRRHPSRFKISYFVDDEGSFIKASNVEDALASTRSLLVSGAREEPNSSVSSVDKDCTWHSAKAVEFLPDDNDAARSSSSDPAFACTCTPKEVTDTPIARPGSDLICVSGPDGFIEAFAGAKRWHDGNEMQGAVGGLLGRMRKDRKTKAGEWLVLKL
ncbi:Sucrase/ferredoxin-like-domain-containing protein [Nemania sp. NC0429]|nr:Sucrase/ferredoxin-like-domain-containing protein [Nemania sp. NC0429]